MMDKDSYSLELIARLSELMKIIDLEIAGFAEFLGKTSSHIYGILNGNRPLSDSLAKEIGNKLGFDGMKIFNLKSKIPDSIITSPELKKFKIEFRDNPEYFLSTKHKRSADTFVAEVLLKTGFLNEERYLSEIKEYCKNELKRTFVKDQLSKGLTYAVHKKLLNSRKKPIKLKNGEFGERLVDVYFIRIS